MTIILPCIEITSFDKISPVNGGYVGAAVYTDASAVENYLLTTYPTVCANVTGGGTIAVPVTTWVDTDNYDPTSAGSYTFTATLNVIPDGYNNSGNNTATVEVVVGSTAYYTYNIGTDGNATIAGYSSRSDSIVFIPDILSGAPVTSIGNWAFNGCSGLTSITIPNSVTSIGGFAFDSCSRLASINIPDSVASINYNPFTHCASLTSITVDENNIAYCALSGVLYNHDKTKIIAYPGGLTSITIPDSVISIGDFAFRDCSSLNSIIIPHNVNNIGDFAFDDCSRLTSITILDGVTSIGISAFSGCSGLTSIAIPDNVINIGGNAFARCSGLRNITIPDSVISIGSAAFYGCSSLTSITVDPNNTTYYSVSGILYNFAMTELIACPGGLTSVTIPDSVTSIGESAFSNCTKMTSITIPAGVISIGSGVFSGCSSLTSITVDPNNTTYCSVAGILYNYNKTELLACPERLTSVTIPESIITISSLAFEECNNLTDINVDTNNTIYCSVGGILYNFAMTELIACPRGLTSVTIPDSVTSIGESAFSNCTKMTSITIPNSIISIDLFAFYQCTGLTDVIIPNSVTNIGDYAFSCSGLTNVIIPDSVTSIGYQAFDSFNSQFMIKGYAPSVAKDYADDNDINFELLGTYTITYDLNGGTGTVPTDTNNYKACTAVTLADGTGLTKSGYTFGGWSITQDGTAVSNPFTMSAANTTLYAVWN